MRDTLSMAFLFPACVKVLERDRVPLHYVELTRRAFALLRRDPERVNWQRQIEDVREKLLIAGMHGTGYLQRPQCLAFMRYWFRSAQEDLFNPDSVIIGASAAAGASGAAEACMRFQHMIGKNPNASIYTRAKAAGKGLTLEKHVQRFFKQHWREFYLDPDNEGNWTQWCEHDFKLALPGQAKPLLIDVWGQAANGQWRAPLGKRPVHLHLQVRIDDPNVAWVGVATEKLFRDGLLPHEALSPVRMCVYLNCLKYGIDYNAILETLRGKAA